MTRRILVFQPDATAPDGASLPVGVVREDGLVPRIQVLVKGTFGFAPAEAGGVSPGIATLVSTQEALVFARRHGQASDAERSADGLVVPADAEIEVLGGRLVRLPGITPTVSVEGLGRAARPVAMTCDSLWIDDDNARLVAVWRGQIEVTNLRAREVERITVALTRGGAPLDPARRPRRASYGFAVESDEEASGPRDEVERGRIAMALLRATSPDAPEPELPLETYATIAAELAEKREPAADTLARHAIDPLDFGVEERAWLGKMGDLAGEGDNTLITRYGQAFLAAQDRLGRPDEARFSLAEYIDVKARLEGGEPIAKVLADHRMTLPEWMRLDRRWTREGEQSPELGDELLRLVKEARGAEPQGSE